MHSVVSKKAQNRFCTEFEIKICSLYILLDYTSGVSSENLPTLLADSAQKESLTYFILSCIGALLKSQ